MSESNISFTNLKIGYCCLNMYLRSLGIFTSRTCRLETIKKNGIEYAYQLAKQNLQDLAVILKWNYENNIFLYRMSSEIFPFATHPDYYQRYNLAQFESLLKNIGILAKKYNQRLTFHPGQHCVVASNRNCVVEHAIIDIDFHAKVMDMMNIDRHGVIVIHGGSKQDSKEIALERFKNNFVNLSESSKQRLVLENCETMYSIEDLLPICQELSIPIVIDYHHHNINPGTKDLSFLTNKVLEIWKKKEITPLFHLSESKPGVQITDSIMTRRAHSDYVENFPKELLEVIKTECIDLDIEAKCKEQAVFKLYSKYNMYTTNKNYTVF